MLTTTRPLLEITVRRNRGVREILVSGELDTASGADLLAAAADAVADGPDVVDFDLSGVSFVDTAGWRSVHEARQLIVDAGGTPRIAALSPAVEQLVRRWIVIGRPAAA
jgi:anti-anti-sigma factor